VIVILSAYGSHAVAVVGNPQLVQSKFGFHPLATAQTQQAFQVGTKLQNISSQYASVLNSASISFVEQLSILSVSAFAAIGLPHHSTAADGSAELVMVAHSVAHESTCKS
jgi:hypothetical protein